MSFGGGGGGGTATPPTQPSGKPQQPSNPGWAEPGKPPPPGWKPNYWNNDIDENGNVRWFSNLTGPGSTIASGGKGNMVR
jgi:hypothetical protein